MDVVCANRLQTYKHEVTLMTQEGDALPTVAAKVRAVGAHMAGPMICTHGGGR